MIMELLTSFQKFNERNSEPCLQDKALYPVNNNSNCNPKKTN